jgi:hypothetical protein
MPNIFVRKPLLSSKISNAVRRKSKKAITQNRAISLESTGGEKNIKKYYNL